MKLDFYILGSYNCVFYFEGFGSLNSFEVWFIYFWRNKVIFEDLEVS